MYLDHAGATIPSKELLRSAFAELEGCSLGNPHSGGSSESMLEEARCLVLNYFGAPLDEYDCVFTPGCSAGMKVIGELFPWGSHGHMVYPVAAHTSLLGMRGYAKRSVSLPSENLFYPTAISECATLENRGMDEEDVVRLGSNLLAMPGECNFTGCKADLVALSLFVRNQRHHSQGLIELQMRAYGGSKQT